jgi:hypothetical protein
MNNKQLAEMIKALRKKKMEEQGSIKQQSKAYLEKEKFKPVHSPDPYNPKGETPNAYAHRMQEAMSATIHSGTGGRHNPRHTIGNISKLPTGRTYEKTGNQSRRPKTYGNKFRPVAEEETEKLGATDTKKKTQSVTITPEIEQFGKQ